MTLLGYEQHTHYYDHRNKCWVTEKYTGEKDPIYCWKCGRKFYWRKGCFLDFLGSHSKVCPECSTHAYEILDKYGYELVPATGCCYVDVKDGITKGPDYNDLLTYGFRHTGGTQDGSRRFIVPLGVFESVPVLPSGESHYVNTYADFTSTYDNNVSADLGREEIQELGRFPITYHRVVDKDGIPRMESKDGQRSTLCCCSEPIKKYSTSGCTSCWTCEVCGNFGGCDNRYWEY